MVRSIAVLLLATSTLSISLKAEPPAAAPTQAARKVADNLATLLADNFVYAKTGTAYAAMLRRNAASGKYDGLASTALADLLTAHLQAIYPDRHLRVRFEQAGAAPANATAQAPVAPSRPRPPMIEQERWIAPGIAFVRLNFFPNDPAITAQVAKFMADYADAKAIIFDIRTHRGGGVEQMDQIFPWLFAKPTRLVTMATRQSVEERQGSPFDNLPSMRRVNGEAEYVTREHWALPNKDARLNKARIYLLTSNSTGSAGEHFSLAMKHTGRGTLIGTHTGGANHFGGGQDLGGGFSAFIPVGRTYDPLTGKDWEGGGVLPDVDVPAEKALVRALEMEGIAMAEAERLSAELPMSQVTRRGNPIMRTSAPAAPAT